jgi:hypothetical protein
MTPATLVNASDLDDWADTKEAESLLPELIRQLTYATRKETEPQYIAFRTGAGVNLSGWDGIVVADNNNDYIPRGSSGWEVSKRTDIRTKANEDYDDRKDDPDRIDPSESTFIFVTPRRWSEKDSWVDEKNDEDNWQQVRAYDADDIHGWLTQCPVVHFWFSQHLGKHPNGVKDLKTFWNDWSQLTDPPTAPELILSGREQVVEHIHRWLESDSPRILLKADTKKEAIAVFSASILQLDCNDKNSFFATSTLVYNSDSWSQLTHSQHPLILIPCYEFEEEISRAEQYDHRIVIPLDRNGRSGSDVVDLPRLDRGLVEEHLIDNLNYPREQAVELSRLARRSFASFQRKISPYPVNQPSWAEPDNIRNLMPAILCGAWDESLDGDREIVEEMCEDSYSDTKEELIRLANIEDPPVRKTGSTWYINSKEEAWSYLTNYMGDSDYDKLRKVSIEVLCESHPRFDLPLEDRWRANVLGHIPDYSSRLKKGLADTLAMIGSIGSHIQLESGTAEDYISRIVKEVFEIAEGNWKIWASFKDYFPLLAEASPTSFLNALEKDLSKENPDQFELFLDKDSSFNSSSPHTGLLWALETLAWQPEYLARVSKILIELAANDPGGQLVNRPLNSLTEIFLLWHPQTKASLDQRIEIFNMLQEKRRDVTSELLINLIPSPRSTATGTHKPKWRDDGAINDPRPTNKEIKRGGIEIIEILLENVGSNIKIWEEIFEKLHNFPPKLRNKSFNLLDSLSPDNLNYSENNALWKTLREFISKHRSFPDADWTLPEQDIEPFEKLLKKFEPADLTDRLGWLFSTDPSLPEGRNQDHKERRKLINQHRKDALQIIVEEENEQYLLEFAQHVEDPRGLGQCLGSYGYFSSDEDDFLEEYLSETNQTFNQLARGFVGGRIKKHGVDWVKQKLYESDGLNDDQQAILLQFLPLESETWDLVEELSKETKHAYWNTIRPIGRLEDDQDSELVIKELLNVNRPFTAIEFASSILRDDSEPQSDLIVRMLEAGLSDSSDKPDEITRMSHHLPKLLNYLNESGEIDNEKLARLEWAYLQVLLPNQYEPVALHQELSKNPQLFCDVICLVYSDKRKEDKEGEDTFTDEEKERAKQALDLLRSWRTVPGQTSSDEISSEKLFSWVEEVRDLTADQGRLEPADFNIGKVLSGSPKDEDGVWPHTAIRNLIEDVQSEDIERGIEVGEFNSRGVVTKNLAEGGQQEIELAEKYEDYASQVQEKWPRTSAMLKRISKSYRQYANREDTEAELFEDIGF